MGVKIGLEAKVYRLSSGSRVSWGAADSNGFAAGSAPAALDEIGNVADLTATVSKGAADVSVRANNGWAAERGVLKRATLDITLKHDPADADFAALMKAYLTNIVIAIAALDGDKAASGATGLWADFEVFDINKAEPLEDAQTLRFTLRPALTIVPPEWVKVT